MANAWIKYNGTYGVSHRMSHDHDAEGAHECGKCGQTFDTEEDLEEHAREEHDMEM